MNWKSSISALWWEPTSKSHYGVIAIDGSPLHSCKSFDVLRATASADHRKLIANLLNGLS